MSRIGHKRQPVPRSCHFWLLAAYLVAAVQHARTADAQQPTPPLTNGQGQLGADETVDATLTESANTEAMSDTPRRQLGNRPDDVGSQLREADRQDDVDAIFDRGPLTPVHRFWDRANEHLEDSLGLDLGLNYTALYQSASSAAGRRDAAGGDLDFFGSWLLTGCEDHWPGYLVFDSETRHRYGPTAPADLDTGTVGGTVVAFGTQDFALVQYYWEQGSFEDGVRYRVGEMDPALIYDGGRYVSSNYAFLSPAFADTLPMPLPGAGLGFAAAAYPTDEFYALGGVHDANGRRTTAGFDTFFGDGEYFTALELGAAPNEGEDDAGLYHVTLWHIDARQAAGRQSDHGVAVTLEQQLGCGGRVVPFLRYAYARRGLNGIRQNISLGVGLEDVLGQNEDLIGLAASWEQPTGPALRDQYVLEAFYRVVLTPYTHITPDIQLVIDPANAPNRDAVAVFGLRLRTLY